MQIQRSIFCYVRNKNGYGDSQGILFDRRRTWPLLQEESLSFMDNHDFVNLIKQICDLRGIQAKGVPVTVDDIQEAREEMQISLSSSGSSSNIYIDHGHGHVEHKETGVHYLRGYACSCILETNPDAERKKRSYRSGKTAAKQAIRTMLPIGYWKTAKLLDAVMYHDHSALKECANDFLGGGRHHLVKGMIPSEVFQILRNPNITL